MFAFSQIQKQIAFKFLHRAQWRKITHKIALHVPTLHPSFSATLSQTFLALRTTNRTLLRYPDDALALSIEPSSRCIQPQHVSCRSFHVGTTSHRPDEDNHDIDPDLGEKLIPKPEMPQNCCGSGCYNCVFNEYFDQLRAYQEQQERLAEAKQRKHGPAAKATSEEEIDDPCMKAFEDLERRLQKKAVPRERTDQ